jgi:hypothetical protein
MRSLKALCFVAVMLLASAGSVAAQAVYGPPVTTTNATAAVNNTVTLSLTPPTPQQYVYVCGLDLTVSNNATGGVVSTNLSFTSINLGGWAYKFSAVNAANTNGIDRSFTWSSCIKSTTAGTGVAIISPAANAQASYSINAYYYYGS